MKPGPQRHKPYSTPTRPTTPRTPKHRLSVDANLQIPEVLNSASKKDLLRRVRHKHRSPIYCTLQSPPKQFSCQSLYGPTTVLDQPKVYRKVAKITKKVGL